jgi:hypothetical protein
MFVYVYDKELNQWIESNNLYPHDIALLIDNKGKKVYLWFGEKSEDADRANGKTLAEELMTKYKMYELVQLTDVVPLKIQSEIEDLLGERGDPRKNKVERTIPLRIFPILAYLSLISFLLIVINNIRMFFWDAVNRIAQVDMYTFNDLFEISAIIGFVTVGLLFVETINAAISKKIFLVVSALASLGVGIGTLLYIGRGELIFEFQPGWTNQIYFIAQVDLAVNLLWLIIAFLGAAGPLLYSIMQIKNTTEIKPKPKKSDLDMSPSGYSVIPHKRIGLKNPPEQPA